jgi:hypothetical protein
VSLTGRRGFKGETKQNKTKQKTNHLLGEMFLCSPCVAKSISVFIISLLSPGAFGGWYEHVHRVVCDVKWVMGKRQTASKICFKRTGGVARWWSACLACTSPWLQFLPPQGFLH